MSMRILTPTASRALRSSATLVAGLVFIGCALMPSAQARNRDAAADGSFAALSQARSEPTPWEAWAAVDRLDRVLTPLKDDADAGAAGALAQEGGEREVAPLLPRGSRGLAERSGWPEGDEPSGGRHCDHCGVEPSAVPEPTSAYLVMVGMSIVLTLALRRRGVRTMRSSV